MKKSIYEKKTKRDPNKNYDVSLIILNGIGKSGKDTMADFVREVAPDNFYVKTVSMVDHVKKVGTLLGWNGEKNERTREFLHHLKMALEYLDDIPMKEVQKNIVEDITFTNVEHYIFFINSREPSDIERLREWSKEQSYNFKTLKVERPGNEEKEVKELIAGIDNYDYDYIVINDGTLEDLKQKAIDFVDNYGDFNKV